MKTDPYCESKMYASDSSFQKYKVYADISLGFLGEGRQRTVGLSTTTFFDLGRT